MLIELPRRPLARIEVPRGSLIKPRADGGIDFVSPFPCPYNYGAIPDLRSPDGDPLDVVVLGPRLPRNAEVFLPVRAVMGFLDAGALDPKVICSAIKLTPAHHAGLERFFRFYAGAKWLVNASRRAPGPTRCLGWQRWRPLNEQGAAAPRSEPPVLPGAPVVPPRRGS